jgi:predicted PurR-regulated permease PerM
LLFVVGYWLFVICCLFIINNQQSTINNQQPTTNNQQSTTNNQQPTINNQQPTTNNQQPTINNQQPTINDQQIISQTKRDRVLETWLDKALDPLRQSVILRKIDL